MPQAAGMWSSEWEAMVSAGVDGSREHPELLHHGKGFTSHCSGSSSLGSRVGRQNGEGYPVISVYHNSGSCREVETTHLRRCLAFIKAVNGFHMVAVHIKGVDNVVTDALSRNKLSSLSLMQGAEPQPVPVPDGVLDVVAWSKPDWTDEGWVRLWDIS